MKKTICEVLLSSRQRSPQKIAVKHKTSNHWQELTWLDYYNKIEAVGCALLSLGLKPTEKVAIFSNTRFEWAVCDYAIMGCGAVTVPIYQTVTPEELTHCLNHSQAKIVFIENKNLFRLFSRIQNQCPTIEKVIVFDPSETMETGMPFSELLALGAQEQREKAVLFEQSCQNAKPEDLASLIFTSGTTGLPKGVMLTHEQIVSEVSEMFPYVGVTEDDTTLTFLPYAHVLGRIEHWGHMWIGFTLAFAESIERVRGNLIEIKPTIMVAVPRIFEKVYAAIWAQMESNAMKTKLFRWALTVGLKVGDYRLRREPIPPHLVLPFQIAKKLVLEKVKAAFGGRLRFAVSGGAPISRDISLFFHACDVLILEGYGLSETTAAITVNAPFDYHFGSVGKPVGDVELKIAEDGEILVRSKKVMTGYYQNPEATAEVLKQGWFHTGDIGEILSSGDLRITDRKKDLIKTSGGKYVAPQHLENLLKLHSFISNVLIHGDQKKYIVALITLDKASLIKFAKERNIDYQDLSQLSQNPVVLELVRKAVAETNTKLASYETIKRFTVLPHEFTVEAGELTPSLKVKRKVLDKKFKKQIEALYS